MKHIILPKFCFRTTNVEANLCRSKILQMKWCNNNCVVSSHCQRSTSYKCCRLDSNSAAWFGNLNSREQRPNKQSATVSNCKEKVFVCARTFKTATVHQFEVTYIWMKTNLELFSQLSTSFSINCWLKPTLNNRKPFLKLLLTSMSFWRLSWKIHISVLCKIL